MVGNLLRINGDLNRMEFPWKLKNNPAAGRWLVVAGLNASLPVECLMKINNAVH